MKKIISIIFVLALFQIGQAQVRDKAVDQPPVKTKRNKNKTGNVGVSIDLTSIFRSLKRNKNCNKLSIIFPVNGSKFKSNVTRPLLLRWKSSKPKLVNSYTVQLVLLNKRKKTILYRAKTDKTQIPWPKQVSWKTLKEGKKTYQWYVMALMKKGSKCKNVVEQTKFTVTSKGQVYVVDKTDDSKVSVSVIKRTAHNPQTGRVIKIKKVKEGDEKYQKRKLLNLEPKNNAHFKSISEIENFTWKLIGEKIAKPTYVIEIVKIGSKKQADIIYHGESSNTRIYAKKVVKFKAGTALSNTVNRNANNNGSFGEGLYKWRVTETTTGISSSYSFFSVSSCVFNFTISNSTIGCLGYVGDKRKFRICFDATYSSASGDLTYANGGSGSGLKVYDQTGIALTNTVLVSPNPTLVTQIGATASTVSYCFEVTVPSSVTSIDFGLQGDDLDPSSGYICQPSAHLVFDNLPSCICDDCDRIQTELTDIKITPKDSLENQYNISGNISLNVPIYGLEFQVQSYSYTAIPNSCSQGVNSIEQSGMILMPGTTVNGSTNLQLFNETISGSSTTNNNATKVVKYTSNTPLTGQIPINLAIGLPGPLAGLNASCCKMSYQVCVKVIIYYDKDSCKSCVITKCFNFTNQ